MWVAPTPLDRDVRSATPPEVVAALAHELGHDMDQPRASELSAARRSGSAWDIAEEKLRGYARAWLELKDTVRTVVEHRLGRYGEERDRALAAGRV